MKIEKDEPFIKQIENLIDPAEVNDLYFFQRFKNLITTKKWVFSIPGSARFEKTITNPT